MARLMLLLIACFSFTGCVKKYYPYEEPIQEVGKHKYVESKSGLVLRQGPGLDYGKMESMPYGAEVKVVEEIGHDFAISGKSGKWNKVSYNGMTGYAFSGFLSENRIMIESTVKKTSEIAKSKETSPSNIKSERTELPKTTGLSRFAYASNDDGSLIRISLAEFENEKERIRKAFLNKKDEFQNIPGPKVDSETESEYLQRALIAKEKFLKSLREFESEFAAKAYSIYDAGLDMGNYHEEISKFEHIGTSISIPWQNEIITLPGIDVGEHGFSNGKRLWIYIPNSLAQRIQDEAGQILVRFDFSYTESVYDVVSWRSRAFVLPKYLLLYNKVTGEPYYECKASHYIEKSTDFAAPLKVNGKIVYENVY